MKKVSFKIMFAMLAGALAVTVFSCKSIQFDLNVCSPIAVLTVYSNPSLPWYDPQAVSSNAVDDSLPGTLLKKANQENPELYTVQDRIDSAYKTIMDALDEAGIETVDAEKISSNDEYQKLSKMFLSSLETDVPASGLKIQDYMSGKKYRSLAQNLGAGGMMFVEFSFYKQKVPSGLHDNYIHARSTMNVYIYDSEGQKIFHKKYTGLSETGTIDDNGSYDKHELVGLYPETVEYAVECLVQDLLK